MVLWMAMLLASSVPDEGEALSRSFYVPVTLELCEHLDDAVLYRGEEPLRTLPGTQIFQFTFFPALGRILPELETVRVEGTHEERVFHAELVVTPASVYLGNKKIDLDLEKQMKRLRSRVDARHEAVTLKLRCGSSCVRRVPRSIKSDESSR
jgi:hypothetical protein